MSHDVLTVERLGARYGEAIVLEDVRLHVRPGEVVTVLGPSGAGKTTLFRCITQLTLPTTGSVEVDGQQLVGRRGRELRSARRRLSVVSQGFDLIQRRTALDNVVAGRIATTPLWRVLVGLPHADERRRAAAALEEVGLAPFAAHRADQLSGGQRQRVAIARALAQESRLVLADEPISSLDPASGAVVLAALRRLAEDHGVGVLCSLHQVDRVPGFADRVIGLRDGRVVLERATANLDDDDVRELYAA